MNGDKDKNAPMKQDNKCDEMRFFSTAVAGCFKPHFENRLTQVFAACFNLDSAFKKDVCRFLGFPLKDTSSISARTQDGRTDLKFVRRKRCQYVIENKNESSLDEAQLKRYREQGEVVAIVKNLPSDADILVGGGYKWRGFPVFRWRDFHAELRERVRHVGTPDVRTNFIRREFVAFLEESGMNSVEEIETEALNQAAQVVAFLKWGKKRTSKNLGGNKPFSTLHDISQMLEGLLLAASEDKDFCRQIGKLKAMSSNPWLAFWYSDKQMPEKDDFAICIEITLGKDRIVKQIERLSCNWSVSRKGKWTLFAAAKVKGNWEWKVATIPKTRPVVKGSYLAERVVQNWKRFLRESQRGARRAAT